VARPPIADGLRLSVATLTVLPVRTGRVDRASAGIAMALSPALGLAIGLVAAGVGLAVTAAGGPVLVAATLVVGAGVLLTRGLHLDGLADTFDGLGSYRDAETALSIMRKPDVGPFGVAAIVIVLLTQVAAVTAVLTRPWPAALAGVAAAVATGRVAIALACRRGIPAARADGMGAVVAGTVGPLAATAGVVAVGACALAAVPDRPWLGPVAVGVGLAAGVLLTGHAVRRFGGITGDVLGAVCEIAVAVTYVALSM
jgi:adenosylcobinamide-GDP ribazoletransferase